MAGEDLGHHPCDDPKTVAMTVAPPPSAEEFLVNRTNNDREVSDSLILDTGSPYLSWTPCFTLNTVTLHASWFSI